jgi:hypothetical protein
MTRKRTTRDASDPQRSITSPVKESCFLHGDFQDGVCPGCVAPSERASVAEPRLRTLSDEVSELRGALIAMLWTDEFETCDGTCDASATLAQCAAVRALGWSEHFDAKAFEQRASR